MATLTTQNPTLMDLAKLRDPDGTIAPVVEILNETNEMLPDMTWIEGNLPTGHRTTIRSGIPGATWRKLYQGVQPNKSTTVQVTEETGMLEAYAEVDKALAELNGNEAAFRLSEDRAHIEGMNQEMQETLLFGNEGEEPEAFTGFTPRFNDLSAENGDNIIDGGGTGSDNQSIWLVVWSPQTCHGIIPKGSSAGLSVKDLGEVTVDTTANFPDASRGLFQAYRTHYRWDAGLSVRDWRYVVRIANIDKSELSKDVSTGADLPDLMFQAMELIPNMSAGRPAFYMSRDMRTFLRRQLSSAVGGSTLTFADVGGHRTMMFQEVPLRRVDKLNVNEAQVT